MFNLMSVFGSFNESQNGPLQSSIISEYYYLHMQLHPMLGSLNQGHGQGHYPINPITQE